MASAYHLYTHVRIVSRCCSQQLPVHARVVEMEACPPSYLSPILRWLETMFVELESKIAAESRNMSFLKHTIERVMKLLVF